MSWGLVLVLGFVVVVVAVDVTVVAATVLVVVVVVVICVDCNVMCAMLLALIASQRYTFWGFCYLTNAPHPLFCARQSGKCNKSTLAHIKLKTIAHQQP